MGLIPPTGSIASVTSVFLNGADFGIAISSDAVISLAEPAIAPLRSYSARVHLNELGDTLNVTVGVVPTPEWHAFGSFAVIEVKVPGNITADSGRMRATFEVEQDITLDFDGIEERLRAGVGSRNVTVHVFSSLGGVIESFIEDEIKYRIDEAVKAKVEAAVKDARPALDEAIGRKQELVKQLQSFDPFGRARIDNAAFLADGMVLRGRISFSRRKPPVILFETTVEQDGLTALQSWIPGGRIDWFDWNWVWHLPNRPPGSSSLPDRFVLRRPPGQGGPLGMEIQLSQRLPGINGPGKVCLRIRGVRVDPVTGQLGQVTASLCQNFGVLIPAKHRDVPHLFAPDLPEESRDVPFPQLALIDLHSPVRPPSSANTLVLYADDPSLPDVAPTLREGLERIRRPDARFGLLGTRSRRVSSLACAAARVRKWRGSAMSWAWP